MEATRKGENRKLVIMKSNKNQNHEAEFSMERHEIDDWVV